MRLIYKRQKRLIYWLVVFILFVFSGAFGVYMARRAPDITQVEEAAAQSERIVLNTRLTFNCVYDLCGHVICEESDMPKEYIGFTKQQLREKLDGISITKFSTKEVILEKHFDCYCEQHILAYLEFGVVKIYRCKHASDEFELLESVEINESALSSEARRGLLYGKVFSNVAEAEKYVKSFS